jgi:hypothetical protein
MMVFEGRRGSKDNKIVRRHDRATGCVVRANWDQVVQQRGRQCLVAKDRISTAPAYERLAETIVDSLPLASQEDRQRRASQLLRIRIGLDSTAPGKGPILTLPQSVEMWGSGNLMYLRLPHETELIYMSRSEDRGREE